MNLEARIAHLASDTDGWRQPDIYILNGQSDEAFKALLDDGRVRVVDPIHEITEDLRELRHPDKNGNYAFKEQYDERMAALGLSYGSWVHLPWKQTVIRYPEAGDHRDLRTFRNQHLVTADEQRVLNRASVAVFGLSVGSNITDQLVQSGIGDTYVLGDFDRLSPTNLNRIRATMGQVGLRKVDIMAQKISEIDPYITQYHLHNGYNDDANAVLDTARPDIIIEEVDDLSTKAKLRAYAAKNKTPLIMVTDLGEKSIIDIERHDQGEVKPFNGKVSQALFEDLIVDGLTEKEKRAALMKIAGVRHLSPRIIESAMDRGKTLGGLPQLGATAVAGAALANTATREILLGRKMRSGSYVQSPGKTLKTQRPTTIKQDIYTYKKFLQFLKS
ncbi:MAG TPA: ThiF family adenylyltransferase [Candidatus Saccharimonadales bacterium]|jgi:molybdopterin/thiamine biosynthesis adenylyltransferase|nr:ThiF family adenylyltransferase [Candidatus Saccharimonadales bacterium]